MATQYPGRRWLMPNCIPDRMLRSIGLPSRHPTISRDDKKSGAVYLMFYGHIPNAKKKIVLANKFYDETQGRHRSEWYLGLMPKSQAAQERYFSEDHDIIENSVTQRTKRISLSSLEQALKALVAK